jgi:regulator of sirC expression with transglutaminase-like and TPR domain
MPSRARERFAELVSGSEADLNLAEAALLIAQEEQPELDVAAYLGRLDALADSVRSRLPEAASFADIIQALNTVLFEEEGLSGNQTDYHDPRNSFLNEVLDRKLGIPITLSLVYIEVGNRLGVPLVGVGFPGHFVVKYAGPDGETVLDPFQAGSRVSQAQMEDKLRAMYGPNNPFAGQLPKLLAAVGKKDMLLRMLRNLKQIYTQKEDFERALSVVERILLVAPDHPVEVRDRGAIHHRMGHQQLAVRDFQRYLQLAPKADDARTVRAVMVRTMAQLN